MSGTNGTTPTADQLEADIARQREQLADTVDALHARLDVKTRAKDKVHELKDQATTDTGKPRPQVAAAALGVLALVAGLVYLRRRR
jgi:LPXTG-motif cell wall-anchored protein